MREKGIWDELVTRLMDTLSSFPGILLALVMISIMKNIYLTLIIALLILFIPSYMRIMQSSMLQYKSADFVKIAEIMGASYLRIYFYTYSA